MVVIRLVGAVGEFRAKRTFPKFDPAAIRFTLGEGPELKLRGLK